MGSRRQWRLCAALLGALSCVCHRPLFAQQGAAFPQTAPVYSQAAPVHFPAAAAGHVIQAPLTQSGMGQPFGAIQQVQNTPQSARAMHRLIEKLPEAMDDLEVIERRSQLVVTRANVARIAIGDQGIIDVVQYGPKEFSIIGLARGSTSLTLWFENELDPLIYTIKTIRDPNADNQRKLDYGRLEKKLAQLFPNSKVYLIPMSWKIIVRGQARDAEEAAHILAVVRGEVINQEGALFGPQPYWNGGGQLTTSGGYIGGPGFGNGLGAWDLAAGFIINELRVPGEYQIGLRVRVAELSRSMLDRAGVDINILFNDARHAITTTMGGAAGSLSGVFENGEIGLFLDYLCSNGTAKILTEPQMTVLSGRSANFLSGGEFAVPTTVGIGGASGVTTSFRGFGTSLMATPTVVDRDLIRISIIAEYSDLNQANSSGGIPGTDSRRVQTVVELREGQTIAMAGLLSHRTRTEVNRIPVLGDIPKVGALLFSSKRKTQEENELLILITPEIVRPMDAHEVPPVPGNEVTVPTHDEFWKYNMTEGQPDVGYHHLPPYGSGSVGTNVDYQHFNPGPAGSMYSPTPTNPNGMGRNPGMVAPTSSPPPSTSPTRLYPVPQASTNGPRSAGPQYSNQTIAPVNSEIRQAGWNQPARQPQQGSSQGQRRY